ncbi:MAG: alkaline phosphatase family protein [Candidatus Baltobacteraceae bacterium]
MTPYRALGAILIALGIASCAGGAGGGARVTALPQRLPPGSSSSSAIAHVVIVIQENRSFDDLFATFPGAAGATKGKTSDGRRILLHQAHLSEPCDFGHSWTGFLRDYDHGKMDGFDLEGSGGQCYGKAGRRAYQYVNPSEIAPYWALAQQYVLADHMFQTQGSGSFTAHQDLIAGGTAIDPIESVVDFPSHSPWGCDAPAGTITSLLKGPGGTTVAPVKLKYLYHGGPFPCFTYRTLRDSLDAKGVSWKYYSPPVRGGTGSLWNAFDAIKAVRNGPEWGTNVTDSEKDIFTDITNGALPAVSWLVPDEMNSDHPGSASDSGPSWVASVVNAVGESSYWDSTAIVVVWDDWGGFYDNVPPPFFDNAGGLGFRVPMIVVSAYARRGASSQGYVSHTQYEFGSILRFVEDNWSLPLVRTTDTRAASIADCFDFSQQPRAFTPIGSKYSRAYFNRQKPSYKPVDSE